MKFDIGDYSANSGVPVTPLLISERSQQILLAALKIMDSRYAWSFDDNFDEVEEILAETYYEITTPMSADFTPVGMVAWFPLGLAGLPDKWLPCAGQALTDIDYPDLYSVIHPNFRTGGGGFNLPDLRERFLYGVTTDSQVSDTGGSTEHALTIAEMPAHAHTFDKGNADGNTARAFESSAATPSFPTQTTSTVGGGEAHNNMPPYARGYWCIKALP